MDEFYRTLDVERFKFFRMKEMYVVLNEDISRIPESRRRDVVERKGMMEMRMNQGEIEDIIRMMLVEKRIGVEEYEGQVLMREGYPGNWKDFTDLLLDKRSVPSIAAIQCDDHMRISFLTTSEWIIYTCILDDDDIFSNLYGLLNEVNVIEVVHDNKRLGEFLDGVGISNQLRTSHGSTTRSLCEYLRVDEIHYEEKEYVRPSVCKLDRNVLAALNVCSDEQYGDEHCVIKTFSCYTNQGWRLLHKYVLQPLRNVDEIEGRLKIVDLFRSLDLGILRTFPDLLRLTKRMRNDRMNLQEITRLLQIIENIPNLIASLGSCDFITPLDNLRCLFEPLRNEIRRVIDVDAAEENLYRIRLSMSERLSTLTRSIDEIDKEIHDEYDRVCQVSPRIKLDKDGLFKICRSEYQKSQDLLKKNGFLSLNFLKGGVSLTTRNLSILNIKKESIKREVEDEEREIMSGMRVMMRAYVSSVESLNHIVAQIDVFNAFAIKAGLSGYSRPLFNDDVFEMRNGFHPVLEDKDYIPVSIRMNEKRMCVVTGPNMGGKSTFLKTCGVVCLLAQIGSYVPAEYANLPILDGIYVRVGANDCSFIGSSTFMVEMSDISRICRMSTSRSLVLIDELGRGTSAIDGLSIAQAVKEYLIEKRTWCLCATHFPELCGDDVLNKKVKNDGTLLMYEVVDGVCDTSFGIMVAEKANFPSEVIEMARAYMESD